MRKPFRIGIADVETFKRRTLAIARGELRPAPDDPKVWFASLDSLAKVLSRDNRRLLAMIADKKPDSIAALATMVGRAPSNVLRTLRTMERHGLVGLEKGAGRTVVPVPVVTGPLQIEVEIELRTAA